MSILCCDKEMATYATGYKLTEEVQFFDIIQDEEIVLVVFQPSFDCLYDDILLSSILLWKVELRGDLGVVRCQCFDALSLCPEDNLVVVLIAISVRDNQFRFADSSQTTDSLDVVILG